MIDEILLQKFITNLTNEDIVGEQFAKSVQKAINACMEDVEKEKFKPGDWLACSKNDEHNRDIINVISVDKNYYYIEDTNGMKCSHSKSFIDDNYHKWSIKDAVAGDILICNFDKLPFIYSGEVSFRYPIPICGIDIYGRLFISDNKAIIVDFSDCSPAKHNESSILLEKIDSCGYKWDKENNVVVIKEDDVDEESLHYIMHLLFNRLNHCGVGTYEYNIYFKAIQLMEKKFGSSCLINKKC